MARFHGLTLAAIAGFLATALLACGNPRSAAGFRLPPGGDPARGQQAFLDLKCNGCHRVSGLDLPAPTVDPPVPVVLGGNVPHVKTDGELLTSIINPSHRIASGYKPEQVSADGKSRMPDLTEAMTVRQMLDLIAFLQSRYNVVRPGGDGH